MQPYHDLRWLGYTATVETSVLDPRQRSAATKRSRTRKALLDAARRLFTERGWQGTRIEDVAGKARVSVATAYNHFRTKQLLMGYVYAPLIEDLVKAADQDIQRKIQPAAGITRHVRNLVNLVREHQDLTVAFLSAVQEQTIKAGGTPSQADDIRTIVPIEQPLVKLIAYGQQCGQLRPELPSPDTGMYHTQALLVRVLTRPAETPQETVGVVLNQLLPALVIDPKDIDNIAGSPDTPHIPGGFPEEDLSSVLQKLAVNRARSSESQEEYRRLANDSLTREYLEAGFRLIAQQFMRSELGVSRKAEQESSPAVFFDWLSISKVLNEVEKTDEHGRNPRNFHERWKRREDYVADLLTYCLWTKHWWPQIVAAERSAVSLSSGADFIDIAHEAAYRDLEAALSNPAVPLSLIMAAISYQHPEFREAMSEIYCGVHGKWIPTYEQVLASYGMRLRHDVTIQDVADIFTALSDGLSLRIRSDANANFIDYRRKRTLLGKAVFAVMVSCIDPGDGLGLEEAVRKLLLHSKGTAT